MIYDEKTKRKVVIGGLVLLMLLLFYRMGASYTGQDWSKRVRDYDKVNRIEIQAPKKEMVVVESMTMVEQLKKYLKPSETIVEQRDQFEEKMKGTPVNIDFYTEDRLLFSEQVYALKEAILDEKEPGKSYSCYIGGEPYAIKIEGHPVQIVGNDAQVDKYLSQFLRAEK